LTRIALKTITCQAATVRFTMPAPKSIPVVPGIPEGSVDVNHRWKYKILRTLNLLMVFPLLSLFTQG
jgi:hypothetical protein